MRWVMLIPLLAVIVLGCVEQKATLNVERNVVYDCQCHEEPWKYPEHYANVTSCKECHGNEILAVHKNLTGWVWDNARDANCTLCHDSSLLANHMPDKCEVCHTTMVERHSKYLDKYIEHEVKP
jgi:DnaJ-class molecular chaperone